MENIKKGNQEHKIFKGRKEKRKNGRAKMKELNHKKRQRMKRVKIKKKPKKKKVKKI